jgi:hypothetical protein
MRNQLKIVYSALTIVAMLGLTSTVHGVPGFARQTGLDCNSCHAPVGFPVLNSFGQAFKAGGYTQASEDNLMGDGEALSIPKTLNAAVIFKMRAHFISTTEKGKYDANTGVVDNTKTTTVGATRVDMPDEWAIWLSGRAGKHIGFATEIGINGQGALAPLGFKVPIVYDIGPLKAGFVPYWTDAQGPGWGFENLSTGAVGNIKMFENGEAQSARMVMDASGLSGMGGSAVGAGVYVWHPMGYVYYSPYLVSGFGADVYDPHFSHNIRVAVTPSFGGIDLAVGFQWMGGNWGTAAGAPVNNAQQTGVLASQARTFNRVNYLGFDAQVMGTIGIPMMLVFTYGQSDSVKDVAGKAIAGFKGSAWTVLLNVTLIEDLLNLGAGLRMSSFAAVDATGAADGTMIGNAAKGDNTITDNQLIGEVKFNIARNLRLSLTGYKALGTVDVADSAGVTKFTTNPTKEDKLLVMLMGGF